MAGESAGAATRRHWHRAVRRDAAATPWERETALSPATASALGTLPETWVVLHDLRWPGRPFATIDHIAIGPAGVFVVDSQRWSGPVQLAGDQLRHGGRPRGREVLSAREAAAAVARRLTYLPPMWVTPVLCIVGSSVAGRAGKVAVCHPGNLADLLTSQPPVLSPEVVRAVADDLRSQLAKSSEPTPRRRSFRRWGRPSF